MAEFRFKVGDLAYDKCGLDDAKLRCKAGQFYLPNSLMIVERLTQECPGGIQRHYVCVIGMSLEPKRFNEIQLAAVEEFDLGELIKLYDESPEGKHKAAMRKMEAVAKEWNKTK